MQAIELHTRDGAYVTTVQLPQFIPSDESGRVRVGLLALPEVILWGLRVFVLDAEVGKYREAIAYTVPLPQF